MISQAFAVVPARKGSKRIPGKNRKPFHGRPIILWVLDCLRDSGIFEEVIVSTNDPEITQIASQAGFEVPFVRPEYLADDHARTQDVANHAIDWFLSQGAPAESHFLLAYPTSVFLTPEKLTSSRALLEPGECDHVFSAARFPAEVERSWRKEKDGSVAPVFPGNQNRRSQDFQETFYDAGQFYWSTRDGWSDDILEKGARRRLFELNRLEAIDINTRDDFAIAEALFQAPS